jgi:hypothetical protein
MKGDPHRGIGVIVESAKMNTWWVVQWKDGSRKMAAQRNLILVPDGVTE